VSVPPEVHRALVEHLLRHAVRRGDFVLKSGRRSNWFVDAKQTTCRPDGMLLVADAILAVLPDDVTAIGGLTMGADAAAFATAAIAAVRGRPLKAFSVRKEEKGHGAGGRIAGALDPGDRVAITEDAVTRGVSMLEAAEVVRAHGAEVVLLVPVVDRGGTVGEMAAELGIRAPSLYKHVAGKAALEAELVAVALAEIGEALHAALDAGDGDRRDDGDGTGRAAPVRRLLAAYRRHALAHPALYRLATSGPLPRHLLPPGLEDWAGEPFLRVTGDPHRGQALWAFAHGMVVLELDRRFPDPTVLDRTWEEGATAFAR